MSKMVSFPIVDLRKTEDIIPAYEEALKTKIPIMIVERRDLLKTE